MCISEQINHLNPPFCVAAKDRPERLRSDIETLRSDECRFEVYELDGSRIRNLDTLYDKLVESLDLPDYFGRNLNALSECLADMELKEPSKGIALVVWNAGDLLIEEEESVLEGFVSVLEDAGEEWSAPVEDGEAWDRPATPFKTVFQFSSDEAKVAEDRMKRAGVYFLSS